MLSLAVVALSCLCVTRASIEKHPMRAYAHTHLTKEISTILSGIDERLRLLDTISSAQIKQARRLDVIQDKLDRVETTLSLRLERAQLAAERLEHRLHMLQTSVQTSIKESSDKLERSHSKIVEVAQNLTTHLDSHRHLLERVSGAYAETWRRGLLLESLMRDGQALVNATRRELADGLRALARRQRETRLTSADVEAAFSKKLNENTNKIDLKMERVLETQKRYVDSCQRVQQDDPAHVANVLDKLIDSIINKTNATFRELQSIRTVIRNHDSKVINQLNSGKSQMNDLTCKRLESAFRNSSQTTFKELELKQLTEKFIALTDRADLALQRLETRMGDDLEDQPLESEVTEADRLMLKLKGIEMEKEQQTIDDDDEMEDDIDLGFYDDGDLMEEDAHILSKHNEVWSTDSADSDTRKGEYGGTGAQKVKVRNREKKNSFVRNEAGDINNWREARQTETTTARLPHRRHPHKHPYDRGPA